MKSYALNKLTLLMQECFQFLYAFCLCLKDKVMFFIWHPSKVFNSVILFNTIQMVNHPTCRQFFFMKLFPYYKMFSNISIVFTCPRMFWHEKIGIITHNYTPTSPIIGVFSFAKLIPTRATACIVPLNVFPAITTSILKETLRLVSNLFYMFFPFFSQSQSSRRFPIALVSSTYMNLNTIWAETFNRKTIPFPRPLKGFTAILASVRIRSHNYIVCYLSSICQGRKLFEKL